MAVKIEDGTSNEAALNSIIDKTSDVTTKNMAKAILKKYPTWAPTDLDDNHTFILGRVKGAYGIN